MSNNLAPRLYHSTNTNLKKTVSLAAHQMASNLLFTVNFNGQSRQSTEHEQSLNMSRHALSVSNGVSCQRNSAQAERSVSRPLSQFECQHLPSLSALHFRCPSAVGETVPLHAPEQPLLPRSFAPHERSWTASQGKHLLQTGYINPGLFNRRW